MSDERDDLQAVERAFWFGDAEHYRACLTPGCLMVFPGMGIVGRKQLIAGIEAGPRWSAVSFQDWRRDDPQEGVAIVAYRATATRAGMDAPYRALCGSVHVRDGGRWRLAFHQQSIEG
ncbi:nuclear transport factor 2 family protein [Sphingosinicella sp. CPCC 101087]|uniref:nuclear transport factor 2 family protein n=1 Tax=Sphingosinicella sp. CPCC 101087 TaxID=2497754 RepID=UPI00101DB6FF|nr:nuclear transport factor 2 family protein [Sphingosinicella sp. CPCC 101087]